MALDRGKRKWRRTERCASECGAGSRNAQEALEFGLLDEVVICTCPGHGWPPSVNDVFDAFEGIITGRLDLYFLRLSLEIAYVFDRFVIGSFNVFFFGHPRGFS